MTLLPLMLAPLLSVFLPVLVQANDVGICDRSASVQKWVVDLYGQTCDRYEASDLAGIQSIRIADSNLKANDLHSFADLEWMSFTNPELRHIPDGYFRDTRRLTGLVLSGGIELRRSTLEELPNLEELTVPNMGVLESGVLSAVPRLRSLSFNRKHGDRLVIKRGALAGLDWLREITFTSGSSTGLRGSVAITPEITIETGALSGLSLNKLIVSGSTIQAGVLDGLKVGSLRIGTDSISGDKGVSEIEQGAFSAIKSVHDVTLVVSDSLFEKLDRKALVGLESARTMTLVFKSTSDFNDPGLLADFDRLWRVNLQPGLGSGDDWKPNDKIMGRMTQAGFTCTTSWRGHHCTR